MNRWQKTLLILAAITFLLIQYRAFQEQKKYTDCHWSKILDGKHNPYQVTLSNTVMRTFIIFLPTAVLYYCLKDIRPINKSTKRTLALLIIAIGGVACTIGLVVFISRISTSIESTTGKTVELPNNFELVEEPQSPKTTTLPQSDGIDFQPLEEESPADIGDIPISNQLKTGAVVSPESEPQPKGRKKTKRISDRKLMDQYISMSLQNKIRLEQIMSKKLAEIEKNPSAYRFTSPPDSLNDTLESIDSTLGSMYHQMLMNSR